LIDLTSGGKAHISSNYFQW